MPEAIYTRLEPFKFAVQKLPGDNKVWEGLVSIGTFQIFFTRDISGLDEFDAMNNLMSQFQLKLKNALL